jgi:hypothetical protein
VSDQTGAFSGMQNKETSVVDDLNEFQIIQEISSRAIRGAGPEWRELIVNYYVEGNHSAETSSYLLEQDEILKEKPLGDVRDLDVWFRKLQKCLSQSGREPFTQCKFHLHSNGKYESKYSYEKVDRAALAIPDWNFFPRKKA